MSVSIVMMRRRLKYFSWRREWSAAAFIMTALLFVYWLSLPPGVVFEDAGMIAAVCYNFGVLHPPGYPLYTLLCAPVARLADVSPLNPAQATALLSAFAAAGAAALFYEICRRLATPMLLSAGAAIALGLGGRFWSQSIIAEVYTLNALLVAATVAAILRVLRQPTKRRFWWLCFLGGLGLSNHWPLYVVNAPVFLLLLAATKWRLLSPRLLAGGFCMTVLGLSPYLYLWLRAMVSAPLAIVTPPQDLAAVVAYISRQAYTAREALEIDGDWMQCAESAWWAMELLAAEYSWWWGAFALYGAWCFCRRRPPTWSAGVLFGVFASAPLLAAALCEDINGGVTRTIFAAYPLPSMIFLMLLITEGLRKFPFAPRAVLAVLLPLVVGATNWTHNNRADDRLAADYATAILQSLPPNAIFASLSDFDFPLFYQHYALAVRPDIALVNDIPDLAGEERRVFISSGKQTNELSRDWGVIQELQAIKTAEIPPPPLMAFYSRLPQWYSAFDSHTREWEHIAVRRGLFDAARMLTIADYRRPLTAKQGAIRDSIVNTPEGLFGQLSARLQGQAGAINIAEIGDTLAILRQVRDNFTPAWQAQILHREGVLNLLQGRLQQARQHWRQALALDSAADNPVLIDLLQMLAAEKEWEEYQRLRRRYWMVKNPALIRSDTACAAAVGQPCEGR